MSEAGHSHAHDLHEPGARARALGWGLGANGVLLVAQLLGAVLFGSLALLADSVHQASDIIGLVVALVALRLSARPDTATFTYGLRRAETLGALGNAILLLASGAWITIEALRRLGESPEVDGPGVLVLAAVGIVVNGASALLIARVAGRSLNLRGAMLHLAYDAASSVAVLGAGIAIVVWGADWVDPAASLLIAALVLWSGGRLLAATVRVLLEAAPTDTEPIADALRDHRDVVDVHHLHLWSLDSEHTALSAHVVVEQADLHDAQAVSDELQEMLRDRFAVAHATLALECHACVDDTPAGHAGRR